jgi:signal recognition particle subunit SRP54
MFHPDRMATRILDMGDILTLIEKAEKAFDQSQAEAMASRMMTGEGFTLEDFIEQLSMLRKLGPIQSLLGMMPGAAKNKDLLSRVNDKDLDRAEAIVRSMTPEERRNPKIINGSRRLRIAKGSGVTVGQVNELVTNFFEGQRQMKMLLGGGMPGMPPGMMGGRRGGAAAQRQAKAAKNKRRHPGGDPRKAALAGSGASGGGPAARGAGNAAAAEPAAPKSMAELSEMLREATEGGGLPGVGGLGGPGDFPGFRGGPGGLPALPPNSQGAGNVPAAFGGPKGSAKKKRKK